jgi:hypothetical protein
VQSDHYEDFFAPELKKHGYAAVYKKKTGEVSQVSKQPPHHPLSPRLLCKPWQAVCHCLGPGVDVLSALTATACPSALASWLCPHCPRPALLQVYTGSSYAIDGCATFFRESRFSLVKKYEVEFNKAALSLSEALGPAASKKAALNRLLKDNVALIVVLEAKEHEGQEAPLQGQSKRQLLCVVSGRTRSSRPQTAACQGAIAQLSSRAHRPSQLGNFVACKNFTHSAFLDIATAKSALPLSKDSAVHQHLSLGPFSDISCLPNAARCSRAGAHRTV